MNTAVFVNFLRHLLFLLVILQLIGGTMIWLTNKSCIRQLKENEIIPWNVIGQFHSFYLAYNLMAMFTRVTEIAIILTTILGFAGAIYLHKYPVINFATAINMLVFATMQLMAGTGMSFFKKSLDIAIDGRLRETFLESNKQDEEKMKEFNATTRDASFSFGLDNEWSVLAAGSEENHNVIDYIQLRTKCCGLTGRNFWRIRIPTSCCKEEFQGPNCTFSRAYLSGCRLMYDTFRACMSGLEFQSIVFGIVAMGTVIVAFSLANYKYKYPDEEYDSESSSSDSDDEY